MDRPRAGAHYPRSVGEFQAWFQSDEDCLDYLEWLRWPAGFACLVCGHHTAWRLGDGRLMCSGCGGRTSATAGTIFDRTRTPLTVWFNACWLFVSGKDGISALSLKRTLEIGSYQTAWAMLHRFRAVLVRPGRERLAGMVQVDETYIGGVEPDLPGGRAQGKKVLTGVAVEVREPKGMGRCRMALRFRGEDPGKLLPAVHQVISLAKRWLLGTHQGAADDAHLASYLNEFVFRFNRRRSRSRGMLFFRVLELAVAHDPVRYNDLITSRRPRRVPPTPPLVRGRPPSLARPPANRPWRSASGYSG